MGAKLTETSLRLRPGFLCGAALLILLSTAIVATAEVADLTAAADTSINSGRANNNSGGTAWFSVGTDGVGSVRRGLLLFDLSSIPEGSTVTAATVQLTVTRVPGSSPVNSTFDFFRLLANWTEGSKSGNNGSSASTGEATWNDRMRGTAGWTTPGAKNDAVASSSASAAVSSARNSRHSWSGSGLTADVQFWVDNPSQNFGWLMASRAEGSRRSVRGFASRESGANAGTLTVTYTPPAPPPPANVPASVSITDPADGATFISPANLTIRATAGDSDGTVVRVEFFDGVNSLGFDTTAPYTKSTTLLPGTHSLTAAATDDDGDSAISGTVTVTVNTEPIVDPIPELILKGDITIELLPIVEGLVAPLGLAVPDDGTGRMFVYDQAGQAWVVTEAEGKLPTALLDVGDRLVPLGNYDERGLLGLAAHPGFVEHPLIYTYTSEPVDGTADFVAVMPDGSTINHQSVIAEWRIDPNDPNRADPNSRRELLRIDQPQANHNGGTLRFGPDGRLYISLGDGGRANDVADGHVEGGNAQSLERIYGKLLRIDVDGDNSDNGQYGIPADNPFVNQNAIGEIFAYGLRNPFTFSFNRLTGDLYLGDAGQNNIEEVDIIVSGGNYGWNIKEGTFWFDSVTDNIGQVVTGPAREVPPDLIDPIAQYDHDEGSVVIGGFVYRGVDVPALQDGYVFGDWGSFARPSARLFTLDPNFIIEELRIGLADRQAGFWLRGFGQDGDGELYVFGSTELGPKGNTGQMLKIVPSLPNAFSQRNLVSDVPGVADLTDPNLITPWGIAIGPGGSIRLSEHGIGRSTVYDSNGTPLHQDFRLPPVAGGTTSAAPTGVVFTETQDFFVGPNTPAEYIFVTKDGTIVATNRTTKHTMNIDLSSTGASYTGIALASWDDTDLVYAANFGLGSVDVFDTDFLPARLDDGSFTDPNLPAGFAPFNIRNVEGSLYVTYAMQDAATGDVVPGLGNGYVDAFDPGGHLLNRFASEGPLNAPYGMALAPGGFGAFGGALLIGNVGDGRINAFNPSTGGWLGAIDNDFGTELEIEELQDMRFGMGGPAGNNRILFFTAGRSSGDGIEGRGLFGGIVATDPQQVLETQGN